MLRSSTELRTNKFRQSFLLLCSSVQLLPLLTTALVTVRNDKIWSKTVWSVLLMTTSTKWRQQGKVEDEWRVLMNFL